MQSNKQKKPALNIICQSIEEREEIQNLIWTLKCRMYEKNSSTALLKLLKANHVSRED